MNSGKLVALDIGGVCISIHPERLLKKLGLAGILHLPSLLMELNGRFETGKISAEEWLEELGKFTGGKYDRAGLIELWNLLLGPSLPGMADAVRRAVRRGWRFVYFSNTSSLHMAHFFRTNDFCHLVTGSVFSYDAGSLKPEEDIYRIFEEKYGVPDFYFDDRAENIAGAVKRNWKNPVLFRSARQLDELLS